MGERVCVFSFSFTRREVQVQCFGVGPRAQFSVVVFQGGSMSGPFGLGISVLLGCAWGEQLSQTLRHLPLVGKA